MRSLKLKDYAKFLAVIVVVISINACKKDDDNDKNDPAYIGTWSRTESIQVDSFTIDLKDVMTLTENTVTNTGQIYNPDTDEWLDLLGMKGSFTVTGNNMAVTVNQVGMSPFDTSGVPTGQLVYFDKNDAEFDAILEELDLNENFDAQYSISGNQLTLKTDDNDDGDFNDDGETQVYTKGTGGM